MNSSTTTDRRFGVGSSRIDLAALLEGRAQASPGRAAVIFLALNKGDRVAYLEQNDRTSVLVIFIGGRCAILQER